MTAFLTVFVSVFLAELGDKTQLATALFAGEGGRSPWIVFLGSACALVISAALATLAGSMLRTFVEGPWLKLAAGAGFVIIGLYTLWSALRPA
ncbi:MAG TPA: TMEM165/GDT1 family protein [Caulobacterales bacterium]|nr:TMEM165/GDT1 family protein [Caulobacterales bacterium]